MWSWPGYRNVRGRLVRRLERGRRGLNRPTVYDAHVSDRQTDETRRRHGPVRRGEELLFNRDLGSNIRGKRNERGLTQDQLAAFAGMTRASIANIERGEQTPGLYRLLLICSGLNCDLAEVLPDVATSPAAVAGSYGDEYSTAVLNVVRKASKRRTTAILAQS